MRPPGSENAALAGAASHHELGGRRQTSEYQNSVRVATVERQIEISKGMFGFEITVRPDPGILRNGGVSHARRDQAMAHARLIRLEHGWPIVDLTGPTPPRAA